MLHIKSLALEPGSSYKYTRVGLSRGSAWSLQAGVICGAESQEGEWHSPAEYLRQGKPFDRFGNKSVHNGQFKGTISRYGTVNGWVVTEPNLSYPSSWMCTLLSEPPTVMVTRTKSMYVLNDVPLIMQAIKYGSSGQETIRSAYGVYMTYYGEYYARLTVHITLDVNQGKWTGVTVAVLTDSDVDTRGYQSILSSQVGKPDKDHTTPPSLSYITMLCTQTLSLLAPIVRSEVINGATHKASSTLRVTSYDFAETSPEDFHIWLSVLRKLGNQHRWTEYELSRHAREVIEAINDFDSNAIAYASDLRSTGDTVRALLALPRDLTNPKAWASAWLSMQFGDRLQIADTKELLESLKRALLSRQYWTKARRRMDWDVIHPTYAESHERVSTIYVANSSYDGVTTAIENLMRWDVWPTLENTWDMVPLSFLVDWVVPVSDLLGQIDAAVEAPYLRTLSQYISDKSTVRMSCPLPGLSGMVEWVTYDRIRHNVCSDVRPFDWAPSLPSFSVEHTLDVLALLVQTT